MDLEFPLKISVDGVEHVVRVGVFWSAAKLYEEVAAATKSKLNGFDLHVSGRVVERDNKFLIGIDRHETVELRRRRLTQLQGFVELVTEACCMTGNDDPHEMRAKMSCCGCALSAEAMDSMCQTELIKGCSKFSCPNCGKPWEFFIVRHVISAVKSSKELDSIVARLNANFENDPSNNIRRCPSCETWTTRESPETCGTADPDKVTCRMCTRQQGRAFEFCWTCGRRWTAGSESCGNCTRAAPELQQLALCGTKKMFGVEGCPETRACPRCGLLLNHVDYCKIMTCPTCKIKFCFICLRIADRYPTAPCGDGDAYGRCLVAGRQTTIPNNWRPGEVQ